MLVNAVNSVDRKYCTLNGNLKKIKSNDFTKLFTVISFNTNIKNKSIVKALILLFMTDGIFLNIKSSNDLIPVSEFLWPDFNKLLGE